MLRRFAQCFSSRRSWQNISRSAINQYSQRIAQCVAAPSTRSLERALAALKQDFRRVTSWPFLLAPKTRTHISSTRVSSGCRKPESAARYSHQQICSTVVVTPCLVQCSSRAVVQRTQQRLDWLVCKAQSWLVAVCTARKLIGKADRAALASAAHSFGRWLSRVDGECCCCDWRQPEAQLDDGVGCAPAAHSLSTWSGLVT